MNPDDVHDEYLLNLNFDPLPLDRYYVVFMARIVHPGELLARLLGWQDNESVQIPFQVVRDEYIGGSDVCLN